MASWLLCGLGAFWVLGALVFAAQMRRGQFVPIKALHQDLAPSAPAAAWWAKNVMLALVGAAWIAAGLLLAAGAPAARAAVVVAAVAIAVEQLAMPLFSPRHWKSYSGVAVGVGLAWLALRLGHVTIFAAPLALSTGLVR